jgi:hypothetical protein
MIPFDSGTFPLWFTDLEYASIAAADFNPIVAYAATPNDIGQYIRSGFAVKNATETKAFIRAITLSQYLANNKSYIGVVPRRIDLGGGEWCLTPLVMVCAANHANYPSTGMTDINVGKIIA